MTKINNNFSMPMSVKSTWDRVNEIDASVKHSAEGGIGALADRLKTSARYRAQSMAIQHGTDAVLKSRWDADLFAGKLSQHAKLSELANKASSGAAAVTYEGLINHIRSGGAVNSFNWKGLLKSRGWHHVDHISGITEGSAKALGKTIAMGIAKFFIVFDALKDGKTSYINSRNSGNGIVKSALNGIGTGAKEIGKSLVSWEAGAFGAALAVVLFPAAGIIGSMVGGILIGGGAGYALERLLPSPKKQPVIINSNSSNPFN